MVSAAIFSEESDNIMGCDCKATATFIDALVQDGRMKIVMMCERCGRMVSVSGDIDAVADVVYKETVRKD